MHESRGGTVLAACRSNLVGLSGARRHAPLLQPPLQSKHAAPVLPALLPVVGRRPSRGPGLARPLDVLSPANLPAQGRKIPASIAGGSTAPGGSGRSPSGERWRRMQDSATGSSRRTWPAHWAVKRGVHQTRPCGASSNLASLSGLPLPGGQSPVFGRRRAPAAGRLSSSGDPSHGASALARAICHRAQRPSPKMSRAPPPARFCADIVARRRATSNDRPPRGRSFVRRSVDSALIPLMPLVQVWTVTTLEDGPAATFASIALLAVPHLLCRRSQCSA
uniref:Uncharacterized protein n=1 Tax=Plectus sambesii TaxID=2011161 RepID=A0A914WC26_9BILA